MTLKNYKRPNGVATQINNVDLSGYINLLGNQSVVVAPDASSFGRLSPAQNNMKLG